MQRLFVSARLVLPAARTVAGDVTELTSRRLIGKIKQTCRTQTRHG